MAAIFFDAYYYMNDDGSRPSEIPEGFKHRTNYEIEGIDHDVLDQDGWYVAEFARLEVHEDMWVVTVGINENTFVLSEDFYFEKIK